MAKQLAEANEKWSPRPLPSFVYQRWRRHPLRVSHLVFAWLFLVTDRNLLKWPNKLKSIRP